MLELKLIHISKEALGKNLICRVAWYIKDP